MQVRFAREGEHIPAHVHIVVDLVWFAEGGRGEGWSREVAKALVRQRGDSGKGHRERVDDRGRVLPWMNKGGGALIVSTTRVGLMKEKRKASEKRSNMFLEGVTCFCGSHATNQPPKDKTKIPTL